MCTGVACCFGRTAQQNASAGKDTFDLMLFIQALDAKVAGYIPVWKVRLLTITGATTLGNRMTCLGIPWFATAIHAGDAQPFGRRRHNLFGRLHVVRPVGSQRHDAVVQWFGRIGVEFLLKFPVGYAAMFARSDKRWGGAVCQ